MPTNDLRAQLCRVLGIEATRPCKTCGGTCSINSGPYRLECPDCYSFGGRIPIPDAEIVEAVEASVEDSQRLEWLITRLGLKDPEDALAPVRDWHDNSDVREAIDAARQDEEGENG